MKKLLTTTAALGLILLLAACGTSAPPVDGNPDPGDPDPGNPGNPPPTAECRVTVTSSQTIPTLFENGPEECDYFFPGNTVYRVTAAVVIEPGTVLRFGQDAILQVVDSGSLTAVGTEAERIRFEGSLNVTGYWYGLCFGDNRESRLENVDVLWAGKVWSTFTSCRGAVSGMVEVGEPLHIVGTRVFGSHTNGLNVKNLTLGEFANNAFGGNLDFGVIIEPTQVHRLDVGTDYLGTSLGQENGRPYVHVGGSLDEPGFRHVWQALNAPYVVNDYALGYISALFVDDGAELVLAPGVRMFFDGDSGLHVWNGSGLWAMGKAGNHVVFSGINEVRGSWSGLWVNESIVEFHNVDILWGGQPAGSRSVALKIDGVYDSAPKYMDGVHLAGSKSCALDIADPLLFMELANITFANNEVDNCGAPLPGQ